MINKQKSYSLALFSTDLFLIMVNIAGAAPVVYVTNTGSNNVFVIDTSTNTVVGSQIPVRYSPFGIAITTKTTPNLPGLQIHFQA